MLQYPRAVQRIKPPALHPFTPPLKSCTSLQSVHHTGHFFSLLIIKGLWGAACLCGALVSHLLNHQSALSIGCSVWSDTPVHRICWEASPLAITCICDVGSWGQLSSMCWTEYRWLPKLYPRYCSRAEHGGEYSVKRALINRSDPRSHHNGWILPEMKAQTTQLS